MSKEKVYASVGLCVQPMMSNEELAGAIADASYNAQNATDELHRRVVLVHLKALQALQLKRVEMLAIADDSPSINIEGTFDDYPKQSSQSSAVRSI